MKIKKLILILCTIVGCTYSFREFLKRDIHSIAIPVFKNKTVKYGLEESLTKHVIDAFIKDNRLKVVDKDLAESILLGEITGYNRIPFSYDEYANVKDYKIELSLKLVYKDSTEKVIFEKSLKEWYTYSSQEPEEKGIEELCKKLSVDILKGVTEEW